MAQLSADQIEFLKSQGIAPTQIFDASNLKSKADIEAQMEALELSLYFGGAACRKAGHTLRTKAGHCIQCDTSKIAYQFRHSSAGYVYLAYSKTKKLVKVGFTKNHPQERINYLRNETYANANDWDLIKIAKFDANAGKKEFAIHSLLEMHMKPIVYKNYKGRLVECREVFNCDLNVAKNAFDSGIKG